MTELSFDTVDSAHEESGFKRGDVVKFYSEDTVLTYPCMVLTCDELEAFRIDALRGILGNRSLLSEGSLYSLYICIDGEVVQIGVLHNTRMRSVLGNKVFDVFSKRVHMDENTTIEGDMLFALCVTIAG